MSHFKVSLNESFTNKLIDGSRWQTHDNEKNGIDKEGQKRGLFTEAYMYKHDSKFCLFYSMQSIV